MDAEVLVKVQGLSMLSLPVQWLLLVVFLVFLVVVVVLRVNTGTFN